MDSHVLRLCVVVFPVKLQGEIRNLITLGREKGYPHNAIKCSPDIRSRPV